MKTVIKEKRFESFPKMKILDCQGSIEVQKTCLITSKVKAVQVMMKIIQNKDNFRMKVRIKELPTKTIIFTRVKTFIEVSRPHSFTPSLSAVMES